MLETKLEELKSELSELRAVIVELTTAIRSAPVPTAAPVEAKPAPVVETVKPEAVKINRDDLQDLCMTIVRNDRAKKNAVKDAIAAFGGAATLKDVPESDLAALKVALDALV